MADEKNREQQSGKQKEKSQQKQNNPFSEQEKHGDEQQRRAPGTEREYRGDQSRQRRAPSVEEEEDDQESERKRALNKEGRGEEEFGFALPLPQSLTLFCRLQDSVASAFRLCSTLAKREYSSSCIDFGSLRHDHYQAHINTHNFGGGER